MAVFDVIEFMDPTGEVIIYKWPQDEYPEITLGSQLIVQESQVAYFYKDGKFLDTFNAGRYSLTTNNLPLLGKVIGAPFGGKSPFSSYVYFVSTKTFTNLGWGTATPLVFRDNDFRMISLRAHGSYTIRISNPAVFLNKIVGTKGLEYTDSLEDFLRTIVISNLNQVLGAKTKSILDLPVLYNEIQETVKNETRGTFEEYGVELVDLFVEAITPPPEVMEMINKATGIEALNPEKYKNIAIADATLEAAKNPNGGMGAFMGAGLGMGTGLSMGQTITNQIGPAQGNQTTANPINNAPKMSAAELKEKLAALKELADQGIITANDFEEQKKKLLNML